MAINILGHFGGKDSFNDGQTVKTKTLYEALKHKNILKIRTTDTYYIKKNPFIFIWQVFRGLCVDKTIIVLLSNRGRNVFFPLLYLAARFLGKRVFHYVIGGKFADDILNNKKMIKYVSSFKGNWLESNLMVQKLNSVGIDNAVLIPNFKSINPLKPENLICSNQIPFKFCTFSRVMKEKGIENAVYSVMNINKTYQNKIVSLDIYGPIDDKYNQEFEELMNNVDESIVYKGVVKPEDSVEVLKDYFMLLFPTAWEGEGIPGTVIDALCAGLPIIASDWTYAKDMLTNGYNALIYDFDKPELLKENILYAIKNHHVINNMKINCVEMAKEYSEDKVVDKILSELLR